ncbi:YciI family protein [Leptospira stimsonii]|nr:YciI family protein [Leptospira stimsonii]
MKKYLFLSIGFEQPTQEIMKAWGTWFALIKDRIADAGGHFSKGREITRNGTIQLPLDLNAITGYLIVHAESMEEAEEIARKCPIITSLKVFEISSSGG